MRKSSTIPTLLIAASLLAACTKPAEQSADNAVGGAETATASAGDVASDAAATSTNAVGGAMAPGGAVSPPPAEQNDAVSIDANKTETTQSPGSNSFTQGQAKGHIENAGYTEVTGLSKTADGMWTGSAKKNGKSVNVSVDFKGAVTAK